MKLQVPHLHAMSAMQTNTKPARRLGILLNTYLSLVKYLILQHVVMQILTWIKSYTLPPNEANIYKNPLVSTLKLKSKPTWIYQLNCQLALYVFISCMTMLPMFIRVVVLGARRSCVDLHITALLFRSALDFVSQYLTRIRLQEETRIKRRRDSRGDENQGETRIKRRRESRGDETQEETRIKRRR